MWAVSVIVEILASMISFGVQLYIMHAFFDKKSNCTPYVTALWGVLFVAVTYFEIGSNLVASLIGVVISILYFGIYCSGKFSIKVLFVFAINTITIFINVVVLSLLAMIMNVETLQLTEYESIGRPLYILTAKSLCILFAYLVVHISKKKYYFGKKECAIAGILFSLYFLSAFISIFIVAYADLSVKYQICFIALNALMLVGILMILWILRELGISNEQRIENTVLKQQIHHQEEMICATEKTYQSIRCFRHDFNRYLGIFKELLEMGDYTTLQRELEQLREQILQPERKIYTANLMLNAVINEKAALCRQKGISFEQRISLPEGLDVLDYAIVLSNLLDNAIEAEMSEAAEDRVIHLSIGYMQGAISILVKNHIARSVLERNPRLCTTKEDKNDHGIGLNSIRAIAKQHGGGMEIYEKEQLFIVHVVLPGDTASVSPVSK